MSKIIMEATLPISEASIGFDPATGTANCLRFVGHIDERSFMPLAVHGEAAVRATLASIGARNVGDVNGARAVVELHDRVGRFIRLRRRDDH